MWEGEEGAERVEDWKEKGRPSFFRRFLSLFEVTGESGIVSFLVGFEGPSWSNQAC